MLKCLNVMSYQQASLKLWGKTLKPCNFVPRYKMMVTIIK